MSTIKTTNIAHPSSASNNIVLDATGNVAIPAGTAALPALYPGTDTNTGLWSPGADTIAASTGGTERARIDSSGRLLVGTSSARTNFYNSTSIATPAVQIEGTNYSTSSNALICNSNNVNNFPIQILAKSAGTTVGSNTLVTSTDIIGQVSFQGSDGTEFIDCAAITAYIDGTPGANDMPGRLVFSTTADGASSPTERMRIDSNGVVSINNSADLGAGLFQVNDAPSRWAITTQCTNPTSGTYYHWSIKSGSANVGTVTSTTTITTFATNSDYRLKENVVSLTGAIDRVNQLQVHRFNFTADPGKTVDGFIAHEAQAVVPECVTGEKDAVDDDGNPIYQGIDPSKLVPLLTAALQEAIAKIETLEAKVAALEAN